MPRLSRGLLARVLRLVALERPSPGESQRDHEIDTATAHERHEAANAVMALDLALELDEDALLAARAQMREQVAVLRRYIQSSS